MDGSGDSKIKVNLADIAASFDYNSREDSYAGDPFQATEEESLHGGSFDPNDSFSWYNQRQSFEDVSDVIISDDEDNIPAGSTCDEDSQNAENSDNDQEEEIPENIEPPVAPRLTNDTGVQCWMNSAVSALLWVFKNFDFEAPNQLLPHQRGFFKELWRLHQINFSCVQNGRPILEYFIEMERLGFEYRTQQQGANVVFEMIGRDTAWLHSKTVFKAQQILKLSPCVCYPNGYESQREQIHPIVQVTAEELFEIDGQRGENYAGTLENAIVAQFQPKALPIPCPNRTRNATDNTYQCPGNCGLVQGTKHWLLRESCAAIVVDCYRSPQNNHNRKIMDEIHLGNTTIELPLVSGEKIQLELMVVIKHFGNTPGGGHYMCFVGEKRPGIQRKIW